MLALLTQNEAIAYALLGYGANPFMESSPNGKTPYDQSEALGKRFELKFRDECNKKSKSFLLSSFLISSFPISSFLFSSFLLSSFLPLSFVLFCFIVLGILLLFLPLLYGHVCHSTVCACTSPHPEQR